MESLLCLSLLFIRIVCGEAGITTACVAAASIKGLWAFFLAQLGCQASAGHEHAMGTLWYQ